MRGNDTQRVKDAMELRAFRLSGDVPRNRIKSPKRPEQPLKVPIRDILLHNAWINGIPLRIF